MIEKRIDYHTKQDENIIFKDVMLINITVSDYQSITLRHKKLSSEKEKIMINRALDFAMDVSDKDFRDESVIHIVKPRVEADFFMKMGFAHFSSASDLCIYIKCQSLARFEFWCKHINSFITDIGFKTIFLDWGYSEQLRIEDVRYELGDCIPYLNTQFEIDMCEIDFNISDDSDDIPEYLKTKLNNDPALREFTERYKYCVICGDENDIEMLVAVYETDKSPLKEKRDKLCELKNLDAVRGIPIKIGISCCGCCFNVFDT